MPANPHRRSCLESGYLIAGGDASPRKPAPPHRRTRPPSRRGSIGAHHKGTHPPSRHAQERWRGQGPVEPLLACALGAADRSRRGAVLLSPPLPQSPASTCPTPCSFPNSRAAPSWKPPPSSIKAASVPRILRFRNNAPRSPPRRRTRRLPRPRRPLEQRRTPGRSHRPRPHHHRQTQAAPLLLDRTRKPSPTCSPPSVEPPTPGACTPQTIFAPLAAFVAASPPTPKRKTPPAGFTLAGRRRRRRLGIFSPDYDSLGRRYDSSTTAR